MYKDIDAQLGAPHRILQAQMHGFARDTLRPAAASLDALGDPQEVIAPGSLLWSTLAACYGQGFHTAIIPQTLGGLGLDGLSLHIAMEELGWGSADFAISLAVTAFPFYAVAADSNLSEEFIRPFVADGNARMVGCWAITEPAHGSDHFFVNAPAFNDAAIKGQAVARQDGNEWIIDGEKSRCVSNGTIATHALVHVAMDPSLGLAGGGVAIIPLNLPGVTKGPALNKLGQRALNQGAIMFNRVRIPSRYMLAGVDIYQQLLDETLSFTNAAMGAIFTGVARAAFEEALDYSKNRIQGGKPICEHQLVQKHLFDMFTRVETSRHLSRAAMIYCRSGRPAAIEYSTAAKVYCTQAAFDVANCALQLFGGNGLSKGFLIEKLFRDARAALIEDGTNDVLALSAARELLERYGKEEEL